jgi:chromosome segregation ATPase
MKEAGLKLILEVLQALVEEDKDAVKDAVRKLSVFAENSDKVQEDRKVKSVDLKEVMNAIIERRTKDVEKLREELKHYLAYAPRRDRELFALELVRIMHEWAEIIRALNRWNTIVNNLVEKKFEEYYKWLEDLQDTADKLGKAIDKLYERWSCD